MADLDPALYTIAWIAPLEIEAQAALHMLDHKHEGRFPTSRGDDYIFEAGDINGHNIIIATLPIGQEYGTGSAAAIASQIKKFFPNLWFGLLVGVAAGLPNHQKDPPIDIRLGDVLVGISTQESAGLVAYDLGKETADGFQLLNGGRVLAPVETVVRSAIGSIKMSLADTEAFLPFYESIKNKRHSSGTFIDPGQEEDVLYYQESSTGTRKVMQREQRPSNKRTRVWYGSIGSGEKLTKNSQKRDHLRDTYNLIGLEMEAAGVMNRVPVGVIRGVCDYADENKNKKWQPFASAMAAAYAKAVLLRIGAGQGAPKPLGQTGTILCDLPTRTDRFFGREDEILEIQNSLDHASGSLKSVVLCGISGSGKTQLAREYVARSANHFSAILWIDASTELTAEQSWNSCASYIQRQGPGLKVPNSNTSLSCFVTEWLRTTAAKNWLVIIDRADAPMAAKRLLDPFTTLSHGSLCVTTTHQAIARAMRTKQIHIERLDPVSSQSLILWRAFESQDGHSSEVRESVIRTAKVLEGFPLALELAGILINEGIVPLKTFAATFVSKYKQLSRFNVDPGTWLWTRSNSLFEMFDDLYQSLVAKSPNAGLLLTLCAVYGPWNLPLSLIRGLQFDTQDERPNDLTRWDQLEALVDDEVELNLAIYEICRVFLAKKQIGADGSILSVVLHGAVCQWRFATIGEQRPEWIMKTSLGLARRREKLKKSSQTSAEKEFQIDVTRGFLHLFDRCLYSIENHVPSKDLEPATGKFARHYSTFCSCSAPLYLSSGNSAKAKELFSAAINFARSSDSYDRDLMHLLCGFAKCSRRVGDLDAAKEALESSLEIAESICGYRSEETLDIVSQLKMVREGIAMEQTHRRRAAVATTGSKLNNVDSDPEPFSPSSAAVATTGSKLNDVESDTEPSKSEETSSKVGRPLLRGLGLRSQPQADERRSQPDLEIVDPVVVPRYTRRSSSFSSFSDERAPQEQANSNRLDLHSHDDLVSQAPGVVSHDVHHILPTEFTIDESIEDPDSGSSTEFTLDESMNGNNSGIALEIFSYQDSAELISSASGVALGLRGVALGLRGVVLGLRGVALGLQGTLRLRVMDGVEVEAIHLTCQPVQRTPWLPSYFQKAHKIALFHTKERQQGAPYGSNCVYFLSTKSPSNKACTQIELANRIKFPGGLYCYPFLFTSENGSFPPPRHFYDCHRCSLKAIVTYYEPSGARREVELAREVIAVSYHTWKEDAISFLDGSPGRIALPYRILIKDTEFFFGDRISISMAVGSRFTSAKSLRWEFGIIQRERYWTPDGENRCTIDPCLITSQAGISVLSETEVVADGIRAGLKHGTLYIPVRIPRPNYKEMDQSEKHHLRTTCTLPSMLVEHYLQVYVTSDFSDSLQEDTFIIRSVPITILNY